MDTEIFESEQRMTLLKPNSVRTWAEMTQGNQCISYTNYLDFIYKEITLIKFLKYSQPILYKAKIFMPAQLKIHFLCQKITDWYNYRMPITRA